MTTSASHVTLTDSGGGRRPAARARRLTSSVMPVRAESRCVTAAAVPRGQPSDSGVTATVTAGAVTVTQCRSQAQCRAAAAAAASGTGQAGSGCGPPAVPLARRTGRRRLSHGDRDCSNGNRDSEAVGP